MTAGALSVDAAESIRAGLGQIDASVTAEKLAAALAALLTEASTVNADEVFKRARRMRDRLDEAGIAAREKQAHDDRYLKIYRLGEEDAGRPPQHRPDRRGLSAAAAEDRRGGRPRPGLRRSRPSVRVIVTEKALTAVPGEEPGTTEPAAHGQIEGNPVPISQETIDRLLCDTGTRPIHGNPDISPVVPRMASSGDPVWDRLCGRLRCVPKMFKDDGVERRGCVNRYVPAHETPNSTGWRRVQRCDPAFSHVVIEEGAEPVNRITAWLPTRIDRRVRVIAWIYLTAQILLVGTGGLVRLTSSGLGCPTWPKCTADSVVNTPEMGIHGYIEFGNRLLGVALGLVAIAAFLAVVRLRKERPDLFWVALLAGLGIPAQAVIGGISVLAQLNPYVVGIHFVISVILVVLCTVFVHRVYTGRVPRTLAVPVWYRTLAYVTSAVVFVTILVGILTTGSGPHAGDADAPRTGLDPEILQHVHSWPAYVTVALTVVLLVAAFSRALPTQGWALLLLLVEAMQVGVGLIQSNTGLPAGLVGIHMVLSCVLVAILTALVLNLSTPMDMRVSPSATTPDLVGRR
ncbi:heme A synthase [Cryobacterium sp. TMT2-18-3]|nr:heme A synthase [Cryobacterium sp. TMT2-18-3]